MKAMTNIHTFRDDVTEIIRRRRLATTSSACVDEALLQIHPACSIPYHCILVHVKDDAGKSADDDDDETDWFVNESDNKITGS